MDYLIKVKGMPFTEAVEQIVGYAAIQQPVREAEKVVWQGGRHGGLS